MAATPTPHGSLFIVYSLVVLYALCYQLQSPIEPFLVDKLLNSTGKGAATASESAVAYVSRLVVPLVPLVQLVQLGGGGGAGHRAGSRGRGGERE